MADQKRHIYDDTPPASVVEQWKKEQAAKKAAKNDPPPAGGDSGVPMTDADIDALSNRLEKAKPQHPKLGR